MHVSQLIQELKTRDLLDMARKIAIKYHISVPEMLEQKHFRPSAHACQEFWHSLYEEGCWTYSALARLTNSDRSTVRKGIKAYEARMLAKVPVEPVSTVRGKIAEMAVYEDEGKGAA